MADADHESQPVRQSLLKRAARKAARLVYRMALPLLRPLAFRTRRYLTQGIQDELSRAAVSTQRMNDELRRIVHEIRHTHAVGLEVLQKTAESVQHQVLINAHHWHTVGYREAQALSAGLHQGIQVSRESIRDEVLRAQDSIRQEVLRSQEVTAAELRAVINESRETIRSVAEDYASNEFARLDRLEQLATISARRVAVHSDHDRVLLKTEVGYVLCADSDHAVLAGLLDTGELERGTRLLIQRFVGRGDVFVDVGAHLGLLSLAAARAMHGQGKIFAFEPFSNTRAMLERSFWLNDFAEMIEVHEAAVSNHNGEAKLFLGATSGHHSIFALDLPSGQERSSIDVRTVTLDSALPPGLTVDLLKIDAEGAELDIIEGARALLAGNPDIALIVELGPSHLKRVGYSLDHWLGVFAEIGFVYRAINLDTGVLENVTSEQLGLAESTNLFFARTGSSAWKKLDIDA
jgi:FkbM family methyltransferase